MVYSEVISNQLSYYVVKNSVKIVLCERFELLKNVSPQCYIYFLPYQTSMAVW